MHRVRERPGDGTLKLAVAILRPLTPSQAPPLVLPHGGPSGPGGIQGGEMGAAVHLAPLLKRDIVVYDQRGAGLSEPEICPGVHDTTPSSRNLSGVLRQQRYNEIAQACAADLRAHGFDPAMFSTVTNAADLIDLRKTLGYASWDVFGVSYGSRVAQEVMRRDPDGVRSAILSAPVIPGPSQEAEGPLAFQRVMDHLFAACAHQPTCATAFPTLEADFYAAYDDLTVTPVDIVVETAGGATTVRFDGERMVRALHGRFARDVSRVPLLITELRRGDRVHAARVLLGTAAVSPSNNQLTNLVGCFESGGPEALTSVLAAVRAQTRAPFSILLNTEEECPFLQARWASAADREWVSSDTPTLIITQEFDDRTPPDHGRRIASHLTHAYVLEEPAKSHGQRPSPCVEGIILTFLENPAREPDRSCLASLPPLHFETKNLDPVTIVVSVASEGAPASPAAGTWEGSFPDAPVIYRFDLRVKGAQLTGAINTAAQSFPIFDGRVAGQTMTFKVTTNDGDRTITFTARLRGDTIAFTRDVAVRPGGRPGGAALFGVSGARLFIVTRSAFR